MASIGDLVANLRVDSRQFTSGIQKSERSLGGFVSNITSGFAKIGLAAEGVRTVFNALIGPMQEAQEAALAQRKLAQVFRSTGNAAGLAASEVEALAAARQQVTSFDADDTINAAAILGSFTNVKGGVFTEGLKSAQDLSAFLGTDLQSSIIMVGKALNDPTKGLTSLGRAGIQFSNSQKEQIKRLQETGNLAKAQTIILKELQTQFGGQAEALVDPIAQAKNAWGDFMETVGGIANEKLLPAIPTLISGFEKVADIITQTVDGIGKMAEAIQYTAFVTSALGSGMNLKDAKAAYDAEFGLKADQTGIGGLAGAMKARNGKGGVTEHPFFGTLQDLINERQNRGLPTDELRGIRNKEQEQWLDAKGLKNPAEQMLAGFIRDGIAAVGSGLMSLGPAAKGDPTNQVGTLEKGSAEAFEVMRANVSPGGKDKTQEKQLAEVQKQTKILGKLEKKMTGPEMAALQLRIMGIED